MLFHSSGVKRLHVRVWTNIIFYPYHNGNVNLYHSYYIIPFFFSFLGDFDMLYISRGGGVLPIMAYFGEAPPERGTFFTFQVYERVGISRVEVYVRSGKSVI